jgi:hypothetical protein
MSEVQPQTPKSVLESKTFWGMVVILVSPVFAKYGLPIEGIAGDTLAQFVGAALTMYGRFTASTPVKLS